MAQPLKAFGVFPEDLGLIPRIRVVVYNCLELQVQDL